MDQLDPDCPSSSRAFRTEFHKTLRVPLREPRRGGCRVPSQTGQFESPVVAEPPQARLLARVSFSCGRRCAADISLVVHLGLQHLATVRTAVIFVGVAGIANLSRAALTPPASG